MTFSPPPFDAPPPPGTRPGSVTATAIIGILYGASRILCTPIGFLPLLIPGDSHEPIIDVYKRNPVLLNIAIALIVIEMLLGIVLITFSVACLNMRLWGRRGIVIWA